MSLGHSRLGILASIGLLMSACYDYAPLTPQPRSNETGAAPTEKKRLPRQSELSAMDIETIQSKSKALLDQCIGLHPDVQGQRAALVRCLVSGNDALWEQSVSDGQKERQQLGAYAIQLAEQEDQGLISREEAESKYANYQAKILENTNPSR